MTHEKEWKKKIITTTTTTTTETADIKFLRTLLRITLRCPSHNA